MLSRRKEKSATTNLTGDAIELVQVLKGQLKGTTVEKNFVEFMESLNVALDRTKNVEGSNRLLLFLSPHLYI